MLELNIILQEKPAEAATLSFEAWQAERLHTVLTQISEAFRYAANSRDRSMLELQQICQSESQAGLQKAGEDD